MCDSIRSIIVVTFCVSIRGYQTCTVIYLVHICSSLFHCDLLNLPFGYAKIANK